VDDGGRDALEAAAAELTQASHRLAEVLYKSTAAPGGPEPPPPAGGSAPPKDGDDVIDAEVVDKK
jgi:hypothetical protein